MLTEDCGASRWSGSPVRRVGDRCADPKLYIQISNPNPKRIEDIADLSSHFLFPSRRRPTSVLGLVVFRPEILGRLSQVVVFPKFSVHIVAASQVGSHRRRLEASI
ncbi:hypothetical protein L6452_03109 [Arctium lappa]|uniref:Uncharacterized protein n=1 Tax=Arctium lappa TaxID=4217 RepID=A0ACB9FLG4_ARCLA|nr:hypothetical protein L6452_03109 [Arctium lappa]